MNEIFQIGGYAATKQGGGSLLMWAHYFGPFSKIIGVDKERKIIDRPENVHIYQASQTDVTFLLNTLCKQRLNIIIDDGSHFSQDIIATFETMWPCLQKQGLYIIEVCLVLGSGNIHMDLFSFMLTIFDICS